MKKINFSVGPVMMYENTKKIGKNEIPYFRTSDFSNIVFEIEENLKKLLKFNKKSKVLLLTGSGSLGMETVVSSAFDETDKLLIINGGNFGQRFVDLAIIYKYNFKELKLNSGQNLTKEKLLQSLTDDITGILINHHETSTGVIYDLSMIKQVAQSKNILLIVDAISSFIAEEIDNSEDVINALILGSQKGLALPPGLSIIVLNEKIIDKIKKIRQKSLYLDINNALSSAKRGQTPFTPAVSIILQLHERLRNLINGGIEKERQNIIQLSSEFRSTINHLGFKLFIEKPSNALTPIFFEKDAYHIFEVLKEEYGIWVAPSGGKLKDNLLRIGHLGNLTKENYYKLINALNEIKKRGEL